jgi:hypothetical protein
MVWFLGQIGGKRSVVSERRFTRNDGVVDGLVHDRSGGKRSVVSERRFGGNDGVVDGLVPRSDWRETLRRFRAKVQRQ